MSSSYRPKGYGASAALKRARQPYRLRNAVTGTLLVGFAVSVWAYSISAVKQDNFDDIDALALDQQRNAQPPAPSPTSTPAALVAPGSAASSSAPKSEPPRSGTSSFFARFRPTILDTFSKGRSADGRLLVWGAPPLSKPGSIGDKTTPSW